MVDKLIKQANLDRNQYINLTNERLEKNVATVYGILKLQLLGDYAALLDYISHYEYETGIVETDITRIYAEFEPPNLLPIRITISKTWNWYISTCAYKATRLGIFTYWVEVDELWEAIIPVN